MIESLTGDTGTDLSESRVVPTYSDGLSAEGPDETEDFQADLAGNRDACTRIATRLSSGCACVGRCSPGDGRSLIVNIVAVIAAHKGCLPF